MFKIVVTDVFVTLYVVYTRNGSVLVLVKVAYDVLVVVCGTVKVVLKCTVTIEVVKVGTTVGTEVVSVIIDVLVEVYVA